MLLEYLNAALDRAHYEMIEDEEPFFGEVPDVRGVWASGKTLEECRRKLAEALEDWVLFSVSRGETPPPIGDVKLALPHRVA
jgi:predicted RNase H-like HicB family nuclease